MSASTRTHDAAQRALDIVVAATILAVLSPVLVAVVLLVVVGLGRPVLFRQPRPGKIGRAFTLVKFRSMLDVDERERLQGCDPRVELKDLPRSFHWPGCASPCHHISESGRHP